MRSEKDQVVFTAATKGQSGFSNRVSRKAVAAEQTRAAILEVALAEFADKGLAGARVDEIARQTATSKHMIYYHFGSKEGLYRAVLDQTYANFRLAEEKIDYTQLDPVEALESLIGLSFDFHLNNPAYVRIIVAENVNNGAHIQHVQNIEARRAILDIMQEIISRGAASGEFRDDIDVMHLHMTISALSFSFVSNRYTFGHIFGVDYAAPEMIEARRAHVIDAALSLCLPRAR
jgi:AcrR family transcriptional regulator